jgi:hypothetical protein
MAIGLTGLQGDAFQALTQVAYAQTNNGRGDGATASSFQHMAHAPGVSPGSAGLGGASADAQRIVNSGIKQILDIVQNTTNSRFNIVG